MYGGKFTVRQQKIYLWNLNILANPTADFARAADCELGLV